MSLDPAARSALAAASIGELAWVASARRPRVEGMVPLLLDGAPTVAFTYAEHDLAVEIASADHVVVTVTEARSTGPAFRPVRYAGRPRLIRDADGDLFVERLLDQELRRYPPSRLLADSPLLRREHWWYLPRMVVTVDVDEVTPISARQPGGTDGTGAHLMAVATPGGLEVQVVTTPPTADGTALQVGGTDLALPRSGVAALFAQDASFPDLERWTSWTYEGSWDAETARFSVTHAPSGAGLEPTPSLLSRWRRQRSLERRCRTALAAYS